MGTLIQQILLSDIFLFFIMGILILLITSWAYSSREYAGYVLGWLLGLLVIIVMSAFSLNADVVVDESDSLLVIGPFTLMLMFVAMMAGLGVGFGLMSLVRSDSYAESRSKRALAVAITTSLTLSSGYFMLISTRSTRLVIAVFMLALAIGGLFNYIFSQRPRGIVPTRADDFPEAEIVIEEQPDPDAPVNRLDLPSPLAQRIHNLQERVRYRGSRNLNG